MRARSLAMLIVAAAVAIGVAWLTLSRREEMTAASPAAGRYLLPSLQNLDTLNGIERMEFESLAATVTVAKVNDRWEAPNTCGYRVDFGKVRNFLRSLALARIGHELSVENSELADLQLVPPSEMRGATDETSGTLVKLFDRDGELVDQLVIGRAHAGAPARNRGMGAAEYANGRFVAIAGKAYLVTEAFAGMPRRDRDLLDDSLSDVAPSNIVEISVSNPTIDGERATYTLKRRDGSRYLLLQDLADDEAMDMSKAQSLANVLSGLAFSDIPDQNLSDKDTGLDNPTVYIAGTADGRVYTLKIGSRPKDGNERYVRLSAALGPAEAGTGAEPGQNQEREKPAREVRDFNDKVGKWLYLVGANKIDDARFLRQELARKRAKPAAQKGADPAQ